MGLNAVFLIVIGTVPNLGLSLVSGSLTRSASILTQPAQPLSLTQEAWLTDAPIPVDDATPQATPITYGAQRPDESRIQPELFALTREGKVLPFVARILVRTLRKQGTAIETMGTRVVVGPRGVRVFATF